MRARENKISAGSYDLNKFLYGGYETDIITTIYGGAGTGKTNFCVLTAVSQAKKNNKVIFIDTEGGFSIERVKQLAEQDYENVLKNIILLKVTSFKEQSKVFSNLLKEIQTKGNIGLIIVDSMAMLYRLEMGDAKQSSELEIQEVNRELARQMKILAEIARLKNIPVLVTNQVYSEFMNEQDFMAKKEKTFKMVGGSILEYWSKCLIELRVDNGKRKAILKKHRSLKERELNFEIFNGGVRRRRWI